MIINNVESSPIQNVLTYVFSEANAPIVILPPHVINGLCKYSNKHYLKVMTPFHASKLLSENPSIISNLTCEKRLLLLKYIILNDPDPNLVLDLELLPLANDSFVSFQNNQATPIYIFANDVEFLKLFHKEQHDRFLNPNIDPNLFEKLSSKSFQGKNTLFCFYLICIRSVFFLTIIHSLFFNCQSLLCCLFFLHGQHKKKREKDLKRTAIEK